MGRILYSLEDEADLAALASNREAAQAATDMVRMPGRMDPAHRQAFKDFEQLAGSYTLVGSTGRAGQPRGARGRMPMFATSYLNRGKIYVR